MTMSVREAIESRRSIRKFEEKSVGDDDIRELLNAARLAPSWANRQEWRFVIVREEATKQQLKETLRETNPVGKHGFKAPVIIVLCAVKDEVTVHQSKPYYLVDAGLAMQNLMLTAVDKGLGTCWIGSFDENRVRDILGIPDSVAIVGITPVGYPAQSPEPRPRMNLDELVHYERWAEGSIGKREG